MGDAAYSFSLTTFSPTGKLLQIEYALAKVADGLPSLGIRGENIGDPTLEELKVFAKDTSIFIKAPNLLRLHTVKRITRYILYMLVIVPLSECFLSHIY